MPMSARNSRSLTSGEQVAAGVERRRVEVAPRDGQHAHALARRAGRSRPAPALGSPSAIARRRPVGVEVARRPGEQHVGRALDEAAHDRRGRRRRSSRGTSPSACTRRRTAPRRRGVDAAGSRRRRGRPWRRGRRAPPRSGRRCTRRRGSRRRWPAPSAAGTARAARRRCRATRRILPVGRVALAVDVEPAADDARAGVRSSG